MRGIARTFWQVARRLATRAATREYPEAAPPLPPRYRGRLVLTRDPDGRERCVACHLCAAVCPVECIDLTKAETEDGRWYADEFRINLARCIFCGLCEEACPTLALQLVPDVELSEYRRDALVYEKEHLTIDGPGKHPDYSYWAVAGMPIEGAGPGTGANEAPPTDLKDLRP